MIDRHFVRRQEATLLKRILIVAPLFAQSAHLPWLTILGAATDCMEQWVFSIGTDSRLPASKVATCVVKPAM